MLGTKQAKRRCRDCANCRRNTEYGVPVCYEIGQLNGKPAATEVSLNDARAENCHKFMGIQIEAMKTTCAAARGR